MKKLILSSLVAMLVAAGCSKSTDTSRSCYECTYYTEKSPTYQRTQLTCGLTEEDVTRINKDTTYIAPFKYYTLCK